MPSTRDIGNAGERRVAEWLEREYGYKIIARNYRCRLGEIDLIAEEAGVLCFVEVRSRTHSRYGEALETINAAKRRRIALTAHHYLVTQSQESRACRFDVVTIQGDKTGQAPDVRPLGPGGSAPMHLLRDAFHLDE